MKNASNSYNAMACFYRALIVVSALAVSLLSPSLSFASQPRIFIESTGAIGHTPRLIGIPAGWNYAPYSPDASLGKISPHGSVIQPATGLTSKVGSPSIPNVLVNSSIEIKSAGLKKAIKSCSRKRNTLFTLASFAAFMIDEGWFLDDNGVLMMENEDCDVLYRGNTSPPLSGGTFPLTQYENITVRDETVTFNSLDEQRAYLDEIIPFLNDYSLSNSRISSDSSTPCPVSDFYGCAVLIVNAEVDGGWYGDYCIGPENQSSTNYPRNCRIVIDVGRFTYYSNQPVSSLDYLILRDFENNPEYGARVSPYRPHIMDPPYVRYTLGEPTCTVVDVVVPQSEIDSAIDSNNFIVQMVDLSKMQFDNSDLLLLEEDISVLVEDIDLDDVESVIETETDNFTGDVTVTETTTDLGVSFANNPSTFPGLDFDVGNTTNTYKDGNLTSSNSTSTSYKSPSSPPVSGGSTGGGSTGGGSTGGGSTGGGSTGGGSTGGGFIDCEFMPTACAFMDWFREEPSEPEDNLDGTLREVFIERESFTFIAPNAACPAPLVLNLSQFGSREVSYQPLCDLAGTMKFLYLTLMSFAAAVLLHRSIARV